MAFGHSTSSTRLRIVVAIAYTVAVCVALLWFAPRAPATPPLLFIALGVPLVFRLVPRNWLYGLRTPRTLGTTEEVWYRQNVITGAVLVIAGIVWLGVLMVR
jgi:uncharacterized membrane protein